MLIPTALHHHYGGQQGRVCVRRDRAAECDRHQRRGRPQVSLRLGLSFVLVYEPEA